MNNKLKLITLAVANTFLLAACQSGSNSGSSQGSTTPITGAHVEADVADGKIYELREYKVDKNGKTLLTLDGYPHGSYKFRHLDRDKNKLVTHYFTDFRTYDAAKASLDSSYLNTNNTAKSALKSSIFESGFVLGFNSSINAPVMNSGENGTCYNFTAQATKNNLYGNFTATNASSSNANVLNEANDISGSYGLFKGSNQLSYSNNYQGSTSDGTYNFTDALTTNVFFTVTGLTANGEQLLAQSADNFVANCGSSIVQTMPMGWMITLQMQLQSSDASQTSALKDTLNAGYSSIINVSNQFSETTSSSQTSFGLNITAQISADYTFQDAQSPVSGIGIPAGSSLMELVSSIESQTNLIGNCESNPNPASSAISKACATSVSQYSNLVNEALARVSADVTAHGLQDVSHADFFPQGITINGGIITATSDNTTGTATYQPLTTSSPFYNTISNPTAKENFALISDPYLSSGSNLGNYIKLIWNLNQLSSAANLYAYIITHTYHANGLNAAQMPTDAAFSDLGQAYFQDAVKLTSLIGPCMQNAAQCTTLPPLTSTSPYDFYNNPTKAPININNNLTSNTKGINSLLLQYGTNYSEWASLGNPNNVWENQDHYYVGNQTPTVNNSVPMQFIYIDAGKIINPTGTGSIGSGIFGVALNGLSMANPFCSPENTTSCIYENNGTNIQAGPLASGTVTLGESPFYYFLPESQGGAGVAGLINGDISAGTVLDNNFTPAQKYVNGYQTRDFPNSSLTYYMNASGTPSANIYPTAGTEINISTGQSGSTSFSISSSGAGTVGTPAGTPGTGYYANGVFGPIGENGQLYSLLQNRNFAENVTGLDPNWVLGTSSLNMLKQQSTSTGCYGGDGAGDNYNDCDGSGLYPYNDSGFTQHFGFDNMFLAGPVSTTIKATRNTVTFTKIPSFFQ